MKINEVERIRAIISERSGVRRAAQRVENLGAKKVDRSKQRRTRRAECNGGPWEKNVGEEERNDGK